MLFRSAADTAQANAKNQVTAASTANQAAQDAGKDIIQLDTALRQATADAATKRQACEGHKPAGDGQPARGDVQLMFRMQACGAESEAPQQKVPVGLYSHQHQAYRKAT